MKLCAGKGNSLSGTGVRGEEGDHVVAGFQAQQHLRSRGPPWGISGVQSRRTDFNSDKGLVTRWEVTGQ